MYEFDLGAKACTPGISSPDASTLVVNPGECCAGGNASQCFSIAAGAWLKPEDDACDEICARTAGFISSSKEIATLQFCSVSFGAISTAAWVFGTFFFWRSIKKSEEEHGLAKCLFIIFGLFTVSNTIAQCVEVGIMYQADPLGAATFIKGAGCFNTAGDSGYQDLVGNLQSARVMVWGEIAIGIVGAFVGAFALYEMFNGGGWHGAALECILLLVEDGVAIGALMFLTSPSNAVVLASFGAMCVVPPPGYSPGDVRMCISELPAGTSPPQKSVNYIGPHLKTCGRTAPHVSANLRINGVRSLDNTAVGLLEKGIGAAAGVAGEAVSIEIFQDVAMRRAAGEGVLVLSYIDTPNASAAEKAGGRLMEAAYGDSLLSSLQGAGVAATSIDLIDLTVDKPGQRLCPPGQFVPDGLSSCAPCEAGSYCLGGSSYRTKCANGDSPAGSSSHAACTCRAGFGGANGKCMLCSRNLCAAGNYTVGCGGDSAGSCRRCAACDAGFYNDGCLRDTPGTGTCIQCPAGQYSSGERCVSCCPTMFNRKYETAAECLDMARVDVSGQGVGAVLSVPNVTTRAIVDGCVSGGVRFNASWTETVAGANGTTEDLRSLAFTCSCAPAACPLGQFLANGGTCVSCCPEDFGTQDSCESLTTPLKTSPLFVGSSDGKVWAVNAASGDKLWEFATGASVTSSPAVVDGVVFVGSWDNKVYALDAASGRKIWDFNSRSSIDSSPAVAYGTVFIGTYDNRVYALDAASGDKLWEFATGASVTSSPAAVDGVVFVGSWDNKVYALDAASGDKLWDFATGDSVLSSPAVADGSVFVGSIGHNKVYTKVVCSRIKNSPAKPSATPSLTSSGISKDRPILLVLLALALELALAL